MVSRRVCLFLKALIFITILWSTVSRANEDSVVESLPLPLASHFKERYRDDLDGILRRGYLRVLTTFNRTNFFLIHGRPAGYEYALLKGYEKYLNKGRGRGELKVVMEFIPVRRDQLIPRLLEGRGDIAAAGLTVTRERAKIADFTRPYLTGVREVVVSHGPMAALRSPGDLSGQSVFVRASSSYYESLRELNRELVGMGKRPVRIPTAPETLETEDILELVNAGAVPLTVADSHLAGIWSRVLKKIVIHDRVALRRGGKIAWMVRKENPRLKSSLNAFLETHRKGTLLGNIFFRRYYKTARWIKNPLSGKKREKARSLERYFRKYASMYGLDWMLIMAMAYQESGLDHTKRNPSGAVGIMQILPETAADKQIGVPDVYSLENNIHAAVKYLDFLIRTYYSDPKINPRDRVRFAMAAYNAGPAKIRRARRLAARMGLNPNRWFRNVEMAVLRIVGQETVRYVSNINKYYIVYRLEHQHARGRLRDKRNIMGGEGGR